MGWSGVRVTAALQALRTKFSDAHPIARDALLSTGDAVLVECLPRSGDKVWGVGAKKCGANLLGRCLMLVRHELTEHQGDGHV